MSEAREDFGRLLGELADLSASSRLERIRSVGPAEEVLLALGDEAERLAVVEVRRAIDASQLITALADEANVPHARARARRAKAQALAPAGRFEEALELCREAEGIATEAGLTVERARARLASLNALAHLGRYAEAVEAGDGAREAFESSGEPKLAARADINLGATHQMRDEPTQALFHYDRARPALLDEPVILAQLDSNRAHALMCLDDYLGAESAFQSAVEAFRQADMSMGAAVVEGNLADLATRQGRLACALSHFESARRHLERDATPGHLARITAEKADALAELGLWDDARRSYEGAIPDLDEHGLSWEAARARAGLGRALARLGDVDPARAVLEEAADAFEILGHRTSRAQVDLARSELDGGGDGAEPRRYLEAALAVFDELPAQAALARCRLAQLALEAGDLSSASTLLDEAFASARELDLAPLLADLHHLRGLLHRARGDKAEAIADLRSAVEQVERLRGSLQAERFRAAFLGERLAVYEDFASAALEQGPSAYADAFRAVELAKSRGLLDRVSGALDLEAAAARENDDEDEGRLAGELAELRARLNWHYSRLSPDSPDAPAAPREEEWKSTVRECEQKLEDLEDRLVVSQGVAGLYARPSNLSEVQACLGARDAIVEYFVAGGELLAFVVRPDAVAVHRGLTSLDAVIGQVRRLQFQLQRAVRAHAVAGRSLDRLTVSARRELHGLWSTLWEPLDIADAERVTVVPHGPLHTVPFHALWDGHAHLIDTHEVTYAPSASLRLQLSRDRETPYEGGGGVVVGVPDEHAPSIAREAEEVAAALETQPRLVGEEATCVRVVDAAAEAEVLHLACHGRFLPGHPLASGLRLADRWLSVREVYSLRLRARLVALSGCETGNNAVDAGDELVGLMRGFLAAGARSVLVSLWTVSDESTTELMTTFYRALRSGHTAASALRSAQREVMSRRPHPAFWAPFVLGGSP